MPRSRWRKRQVSPNPVGWLQTGTGSAAMGCIFVSSVSQRRQAGCRSRLHCVTARQVAREVAAARFLHKLERAGVYPGIFGDAPLFRPPDAPYPSPRFIDHDLICSRTGRVELFLPVVLKEQPLQKWLILVTNCRHPFLKIRLWRTAAPTAQGDSARDSRPGTPI